MEIILSIRKDISDFFLDDSCVLFFLVCQLARALLMGSGSPLVHGAVLFVNPIDAMQMARFTPLKGASSLEY